MFVLSNVTELEYKLYNGSNCTPPLTIKYFRAYGVEKYKLKEFNDHLKKNACSRLWGIYFGSWTGLYICFISVIFVGMSLKLF